MNMKELKTLKDLEEGKYSFKGLVRLDHLKAEAVKDYKDNIEMYGAVFFTTEEQDAVRRYIKWKNNLTEADLK